MACPYTEHLEDFDFRTDDVDRSSTFHRQCPLFPQSLDRRRRRFQVVRPLTVRVACVSELRAIALDSDAASAASSSASPRRLPRRTNCRLYVARWTRQNQRLTERERWPAGMTELLMNETSGRHHGYAVHRSFLHFLSLSSGTALFVYRCAVQVF